MNPSPSKSSLAASPVNLHSRRPSEPRHIISVTRLNSLLPPAAHSLLQQPASRIEEKVTKSPGQSQTTPSNSIHDSQKLMGGGKELSRKSVGGKLWEPYVPYSFVEDEKGCNVDEYFTHSKDSYDAFVSSLFTGGIIRFALDGGDYQKDRHYISLPKNTSVDDVALYMASVWRKRTPKLVLTVISSSDYYHTWTKARFAEDLQTGLMQAANLTEMWILTEGLDVGVSKLIGDAAFNEMTRRKNIELNPLHIKNIQAERLPHLNIFGVVAKSKLLYSEVLSSKSKTSFDVDDLGDYSAKQLFELNPDHTNFFIIDDENDIDTLNNFRFALELRFTKPVGKPRRYHRLYMSEGEDLKENNTKVEESTLTPVVGLLVQGGPPDIEHTLNLLKKKIPVVVVRGSGLAADLVSFAYLEMAKRQDSEYLDGYIKPELMRRVTEAFPRVFATNEIARKVCRDKIIECVRNGKQENLTFLIVIDTQNLEVRLSDLSKYLLMALFESKSVGIDALWQEQVQWDLQLALDWNRPDLAQSHIFNRYNLDRFRVEDHMFHEALLRPNRESFLELFLARGMPVHEYLNHKRLLHLFENALDKDFFIGICLEKILKKNLEARKSVYDNFIGDVNCDLNQLLYKCTGLQKLVDPYELSMNSLGSFVTDRAVAERRAVNALIFWATLTNRVELAKVLWKRTEDPIAVALLVSMILHQISTYWCEDIDMKVKVKASARTFGKMAVEMLNLSYEESSTFTFAALNRPLEDFNNCSLMEIARVSQNKHFIAHPCCQKWLVQRWHGNISVREAGWGIFPLPEFIKIYLSMFLILPMYVWISFVQDESKKTDEREVEPDEVADEADNPMLLQVSSMENEFLNRAVLLGTYIRTMWSRCGSAANLPFWTKIKYLWSAPISKFWLYLGFYLAYLAVYTYALWTPACGVFLLNTIVFCWTFSIWIEIVREAYIRNKLHPELSIKWELSETVIVLAFLFVHLALRILPHFFPVVSFMLSKFLISMGLLFFFYRGMFIFIPASSELGPTLINLLAMVRNDFKNWIKVYLIIAAAGAATIHAVIYPSATMSQDTLRAALKRAVFTVVISDISDIDGSDDCSHLYDRDDVKYCQGGVNDSISTRLETCPHKSWNNYLIVGQYIVLARLILWAILYAMFAATIAKTRSESVELWKYQRHMVILEFEERTILPPPLTFITYLIWGVQGIWRLLCKAIRSCGMLCGLCAPPHTPTKDNAKVMPRRHTKDYNYWKNCIGQFVERKEKKEEEDKAPKTQNDRLNRLMEEVRIQRSLGQQLGERVIQLERNLTNTCLLLEEMKHMIGRFNPKAEFLAPESKKLIHIVSRQSPYTGTSISRFPVFDKYVPWEVPFEAYDPEVYTKQVTKFPENLQIFVDPDVIELMKAAEERQKLPIEEQSQLPPLPEFNPLYNTSCNITIDDVHTNVDRTSWITVDNHPLSYRLDALGIPQNPLGRTGLRGRGSLWRWGPNHRIAAVISRWRQKYSATGEPKGYIVVEGKQVLEFIVVKHLETGEMALPGANVYGKTTPYSVMCEQFLKSVLMDEDVEGSLQLEKEDMIKFFAQFARASSKVPFTGINSVTGFTASILYRGYIDDPHNTDNAWLEAEVWNFHFDNQDMLNEKIKEREKMWQEASPYLRLYGNQASIVMKAAQVHKAYI